MQAKLQQKQRWQEQGGTFLLPGMFGLTGPFFPSKTLSSETERKRWTETDVSSNRPCSGSNNQKFPCCQPACLRLLESHAASINQVSAQTCGSKRNCERHGGPTGQEADGKEAGMKEGSWVCGKRVKCGEEYSCCVEVMSIHLHLLFILPLPISTLSTSL